MLPGEALRRESILVHARNPLLYLHLNDYTIPRGACQRKIGGITKIENVSFVRIETGGFSMYNKSILSKEGRKAK